MLQDPKKLVGKLKLDITHLRNEKNRELQALGGYLFSYYSQHRNSPIPITLTPEIKKSLERLLELETHLQTLRQEIEDLKKATEIESY